MPPSDSDNEALLSRVSKAADGTDTAEKDMVLCQVESVLMGDPLAPSPDSGGVKEALEQTIIDAWNAFGIKPITTIEEADSLAVIGDGDLAEQIKTMVEEVAALSRPSHCTERREELALPPVKRIEMVKGFFPEEPADPMWRVEVSGIVTDFDTETAANNFRNAILALTEQNSGPTAGTLSPKCATCGAPLSCGCPNCKRLWES